MARRTIACVLIAFSVLAAQPADCADVLYDTSSQPVDYNGNFSDGVWLAISFETKAGTDRLDSLSILLRNPNFLSSGSVQFSLFDDAGPGGLPGDAIDLPLGSVPIAGISTNSYQQVTLAGLNRPVDANRNYWIVVASSGIGSTFYIGATQTAGGVTAGSLGFTTSFDLGVSWNPASTSFYANARIVGVPEPSATILGMIAGLTFAIQAFRNRASRAESNVAI